MSNNQAQAALRGCWEMIVDGEAGFHLFGYNFSLIFRPVLGLSGSNG